MYCTKIVYYQDLLSLDIYAVERNRVLAKVHFVCIVDFI